MKNFIKSNLLNIIAILFTSFYITTLVDLLSDMLFFNKNLYYKTIYPLYYIIYLTFMPILIWAIFTGYKKNNKKWQTFNVAIILSIIALVVELSQQLFLLIGPSVISLRNVIKNPTDFEIATTSQISSNDIIFLLRILTEIIPVVVGIFIFYMVQKNISLNLQIKSKIMRYNILDIVNKRQGNDVVLCINEKTNKPVVLQEEDRFLHMMIVGATGTGKTSSVLLKMVLQDIKRKKYWLMKVNKEIEKLINEKKVLFINPFKPKNEYLTFDDIDMLPSDMDKIEDEIRIDVNKCEELYKNFIEKFFNKNEKNIMLKFRDERKDILNKISQLLKQLDNASDDEKENILNDLEILRKRKNELYISELSMNYPLKVKQKLSELMNKIYKSLRENRKRPKSDFVERIDTYNKVYDYLEKFMEAYNNFTNSSCSLRYSDTLKTLNEIYNKIYKLQGNIGITVVEPKGDFAEKAARLCKANGVPCVHIDPTNNKEWAINVMQGEPEETAEIVSSVLKSMFGKQEAFFANLQEDVCKNYVKLIKYIHGNECDLTMLRRLLRDTDMLEKEVEQLKELYVQTQDIRMQDLIDYFEDEILNSKHYEDILKWTIGLRVQLDNLLSKEELNKAMSPFKNEKVIDIDKHLRNGGILFVNTALGAFGNVSSAFGKLVLLSIEYAVFRRKGDGTDTMHVFYVDEFPEYVNESFKRFLTLGRSYRTSIVMAIQNLSQLIIDGSTAFMDIVKGNSATKLTFGRGEIEDVEYFTKYFGTEKEVQIDNSYTQSASIFMPHPNANKTQKYSVSDRNKFNINEIQDLPFQYVVYKTVNRGSNLPASIGRVEFVEEKEFEINEKPLYNVIYNPLYNAIKKKSNNSYIRIIDDLALEKENNKNDNKDISQEIKIDKTSNLVTDDDFE